MILEESHKYNIEWDQTKSETKNMVSMWFKNETNLVVMIDLLRTVKEFQASQRLDQSLRKTLCVLLEFTESKLQFFQQEI